MPHGGETVRVDRQMYGGSGSERARWSGNKDEVGQIGGEVVDGMVIQLTQTSLSSGALFIDCWHKLV